MKTKLILLVSLVLIVALSVGFVGVRPVKAAQVPESKPAKVAPAAVACITVPFDFVTLDNGMPQEKWAKDTFHSKVTICPNGPGAYQVTFVDDGSTFVTLAAKSPGGNGSTFVAAGVKGTITGGEVVIVHGVLRSPMPSHIGPIDFTNDYTQWKYLRPFFSSITSVDYVSWGWKYTTCGNGFWLDNDATETLYNSVGPNSTMGDIKGEPAACQNQPAAAQWFNPNDGRVDPRPGDRLAVYCNTTAKPPTVVVYGTADNVPDNQKGFLLGVFNYANLVKAGQNGLTVNAGVNGAISLMTDGNGHFYAAWNGGQFHATGQGDFSKSFACTFPSAQ